MALTPNDSNMKNSKKKIKNSGQSPFTNTLNTGIEEIMKNPSLLKLFKEKFKDVDKNDLIVNLVTILIEISLRKRKLPKNIPHQVMTSFRKKLIAT